MKIAFIVGSLEIGRDGVGDYAHALAQECVRQGHSCILLALNDRWLTSPQSSTVSVDGLEGMGIEVLRLPRLLSWRERILLAEKFLSAFHPDWVSLQFVSYAFQNKGVVHNLAASLRPLLANRHVHVMFHELWIGANEEATRREKLVGKLQKYYIFELLRRIKPAVVHTSNTSYIYMLARNGIPAEMLPLFGSIPIVPKAEEWLYERCEKAEIDLNEASRKQWWVFGFFGSLPAAWPTEPLLGQIHQAALRCDRRVLIMSAGRMGGEDRWNCMATEYANRFHFLKLGELPIDKVSQYLRFVDFGIAPTSYHQLKKSSVVAAMTEHGLPVIANRDDWHLPDQDAAMPAPDSLIYKLDDTLQDKLVSGSSKQKPENKLPQITHKFLESLCPGVV